MEASGVGDVVGSPQVIGQPSSRIQHCLESSDQVHHFRPARMPLSKRVNTRLTTSITLWQLCSIWWQCRPLSSSHWLLLWSSAGLTTVNLIRHLQSGQNAAARIWLIFGLGLCRSKHSERTNILHYEFTSQRTSSKSPYLLLTYRTVNDSVPVYLSSYFTRVADVLSRLRLRSSTSDQLIIPSYNLASVSRRAFPVSTTNLWNRHTAHLTSAPVFRQRLMTSLFQGSYPDLIIWHSELTYCCGPSSNLCYLWHIENVVVDNNEQAWH